MGVFRKVWTLIPMYLHTPLEFMAEHLNVGGDYLDPWSTCSPVRSRKQSGIPGGTSTMFYNQSQLHYPILLQWYLIRETIQTGQLFLFVPLAANLTEERLYTGLG